MNRRHFILPMAALVLVLLLSACGTAEPGSEPDSNAYQKITAEEAKTRMEEGDVVVVDVRRAEEYEAGHIPGAILIPNEEITNTQPEALPDLDAALIVYCRTGVRSKEAVDKLIELGYTNVSDMGGIADWPYDTVTGSEPGDYGSTEAGDAPTGSEEENQPGVLSSFTSTNLEGEEVDQSILADYDVTMVNVWATFCGPCLREMPDLGELAQEYQDQGVQIIGLVSDTLNSDGTLSESQIEVAKDIVAQTGANYPHILPSEDLMGLLSQIYAVPTTFFVNSEGEQIGSTYVKFMNKEKWSKVIDEVLAEVTQ